MHTARLLTVSPSMSCAGGVWSRGVSGHRGMSAPGGPVCSREEGGIPACTEANLPPPREQNDRLVQKYYLAGGNKTSVRFGLTNY